MDYSAIFSIFNFAIPTLIIVICAGVIAGQSKDERFAFTPIFWFLLASIVYFGFGPFIYIFGNRETVNYLQRFNNIGEIDLFETNLLNIVGFLITILAYKVTPEYNFKFLKSKCLVSSNNICFFIFVILFIAGTLVGYLHNCYKFNFGQIFNMFRELQYSILFIGGFALSREINLRNIFFYLTIILVTLTALLSMSKFVFLQCLIAIILGFYLKFFDRRYICIGFIGIILSFPILDRIKANIGFNGISNITNCANEQPQQPKPIEQPQQPSFTHIFLNMKNSLRWGDGHTVNFAWARVVLVPNQAYVMSLYKDGYVNGSLRQALWMGVPRILYPSKPVIHPMRDITYGERNLILNSGYYAEGFWNYGWSGVIFVSIIFGIYLKIGSLIARSLIENRIYVYYPIIFILIISAHRVEDWFTSNVLNSIFKIVYIMCVVYIVNYFYERFRQL